MGNLKICLESHENAIVKINYRMLTQWNTKQPLKDRVLEVPNKCAINMYKNPSQ